MNIFWKNCNENNLDVFEKWIEKDNDFNALEFAISVLTFRMKEKMTKVQKRKNKLNFQICCFWNSANGLRHQAVGLVRGCSQ